MSLLRQRSLAAAVVVALAVIAVVMSVAAVKRLRSAGESRRALTPPLVRAVSAAKGAEQAGLRLGNAKATILIVEFSDFQCPFCARMASVLDSLRTRHGGSVAILFRHLPSTSKHPFAFAAALASECANAQGVFREFHDVLFTNQSLIRSADFSRFARMAGVRDTTAFQLCVRDSTFVDHVRRDLATAGTLGIRGTPAVFFHGVGFEGAASLTFVDSLLRVTRSRASRN
jgi:protein-disulfide isomerase